MPYHVLSYLEEAYEKHPERIALSDANTQMSYREVLEYVTSLGSRIADRVGQTKAPIAVLIRRDIYDVLFFFSIAWSGNFYVPIDPSLPMGRISQMLHDIDPLLILSHDGKRIPSEIPDSLLWIENGLPQGVPSMKSAPWNACKDTDPLYVIFTSGSTGVPKGVTVSHRSVIDMAEQFQAVFNFPDGSVFGNQAPFDFDVSVKDIYLSLKVCGRLEILEKKLFSFPKLLIERLNERKVDTIIWAVPALRIMWELKAFEEEKPQYLKNIMFSGEVIPPKALAYWRTITPEARYVNLYGPTEITCNCTYHIVEEDQREDEGIPIGVPFPNCEVFLLSGDNPTAEGEIGEICVAGSCLALGYYNRPDQTAAAFVRNPLCQAYGETIYRTGDLGRLENGVLFYTGRADTQIKHMGHRIELGEIELCANSCAGAEVCACVYNREQSKITLFYTGDGSPDEIFGHLRTRLPRYMLPSTIRKTEAFPKTRTGKLDRKALLALSLEEN